ncbi:MAG: signal peptidase II [Asticcacaulis sp. 32-58-5]|nr:MAG: signal peptidase II [Asticcacaulis sp. 32-58-5]
MADTLSALEARFQGRVRRHGLIGLIVAMVALILDQISKHWILFGINLPVQQQIKVLPFFHLSMVWNDGVSFGLLGADGLGRWLLVLFSIVVSGFLINWVRKVDKPWLAWSLGLVIGGAIGNAIDRIRFGAVVDFLDFSGLYFPWVFNIADACISIGVVMLIWEVFTTKESDTKA